MIAPRPHATIRMRLTTRKSAQQPEATSSLPAAKDRVTPARGQPREAQSPCQRLAVGQSHTEDSTEPLGLHPRSRSRQLLAPRCSCQQTAGHRPRLLALSEAQRPVRLTRRPATSRVLMCSSCGYAHIILLAHTGTSHVIKCLEVFTPKAGFRYRLACRLCVTEHIGPRFLRILQAMPPFHPTLVT